MKQLSLTAEEVAKLLHYEPETGLFFWKARAGGMLGGEQAGTLYKNGRRYITIGRKRYFAHRIAWLLVHGEWPMAQLDHRDLNRDNNAIDNLRLASRQGNAANRRVLPNNVSGLKGVNKRIGRRGKVKWRARIRVNDRLIHIGQFETAEEANQAYARAAKQHFGEFARAS